MVSYVQDVRAVRIMKRSLSDLHFILCKVRLVGAWIKRRELLDGAKRFRSEKLREHQYREGCAITLEEKRVEWDEENNVVHMWEQVKWAMVESAREVCGSVKVGGKNPKSVWWNDEVKDAAKRKGAACKEVLGVRDEDIKERFMEAYKEEKRKSKRCIYQNKKEVNK